MSAADKHREAIERLRRSVGRHAISEARDLPANLVPAALAEALLTALVANARDGDAHWQVAEFLRSLRLRAPHYFDRRPALRRENEDIVKKE